MSLRPTLVLSYHREYVRSLQWLRACIRRQRGRASERGVVHLHRAGRSSTEECCVGFAGVRGGRLLLLSTPEAGVPIAPAASVGRTAECVPRPTQWPAAVHPVAHISLQ